jgi:hypothetical protein
METNSVITTHLQTPLPRCSASARQLFLGCHLQTPQFIHLGLQAIEVCDDAALVSERWQRNLDAFE